MTENRHAGRRVLHLAPAACITLALTACMADGGQLLNGPGFSGTALSAAPAPSHRATYRCVSGGAIMVETTAGAAHLVDTEGMSYDLPASPPAQGSRFGEGSVALVVEGGEALWMKAGREPMTCRQ